MWRLIRGLGLAYGYNLFAVPNSGMLYLTLDSSTNVIAAYKEAKSIVVRCAIIVDTEAKNTNMRIAGSSASFLKS